MIAISESSQEDASVEGYWNILKALLLKSIDRICGWAKDPARKRETNAVVECCKTMVKPKLWKYLQFWS